LPSFSLAAWRNRSLVNMGLSWFSYAGISEAEIS
jgi:hypothetical protein